MAEGMWEVRGSEAHSMDLWWIYTTAPNADNDYKQRQRFPATDIGPESKN